MNRRSYFFDARIKEKTHTQRWVAAREYVNECSLCIQESKRLCEPGDSTYWRLQWKTSDPSLKQHKDHNLMFVQMDPNDSLINTLDAIFVAGSDAGRGVKTGGYDGYQPGFILYKYSSCPCLVWKASSHEEGESKECDWKLAVLNRTVIIPWSWNLVRSSGSDNSLQPINNEFMAYVKCRNGYDFNSSEQHFMLQRIGSALVSRQAPPAPGPERRRPSDQLRSSRLGDDNAPWATGPLPRTIGQTRKVSDRNEN